jgi:tetratricopeptide (TPR) repeat protein
MAAFPEAPETAEGMLKLSFLVDDATAIALLDQVVATFPDRAGEALAAKVEVLTDLNSPEAAAQTRETLFTTYGESEAAADLRFRYARDAGQGGDWSGAIAWAEQILDQNPDSDVAAKAAFWAGKWQLRAGQAAAAQDHFERVLRDYPESYFAWRAAVALGWEEVGDFQTVRNLQPTVALPSQRQPLPVGSETLLQSCINWGKTKMPGPLGNWNLPIAKPPPLRTSSPMASCAWGWGTTWTVSIWCPVWPGEKPPRNKPPMTRFSDTQPMTRPSILFPLPKRSPAGPPSGSLTPS